MANRIFLGKCQKCGYAALFGAKNTNDAAIEFIKLHAHYNDEELIELGSFGHPRTPCEHAKFYQH